MASLRLFTVLLLAALVHSSLSLTKCNPKIIECIKYIWYKNGMPSSAFKDMIASTKDNIIATTHGYYPKCTACAFLKYSKTNTLDLTLVLRNGTNIVEKNEYYEEHGMIITKDKKIRRYIILNENSVVLWYKCSESAPEGKPEGGVKVKHGATYDKKVYQKALAIAKKLGFPLTEFYPPDC